jgi:hypothetical protein
MTPSSITIQASTAPGGVTAQPTPEEQAAMREQHFQPTANQCRTSRRCQSGQESACVREQWAARHGGDGFGEWTALQPAGTHREWRFLRTIDAPRNEEPGEAAKRDVNGEIHNDRAANGGTLTPQERQQVNGQQNNLSNSIYNDKHNGATDQYGNNEVGARRDNQQQRIANGINSGQMSPSEAAKAENHEQKINSNVRADRQANGGKLTPQEKKNINKQQNSASKQIYNEKHNEKTAPR